ncbi:Ldh family oxidoreductase [Symmachiella dynata]|uniref:Ldh family oxidoreductase n=1 Tax=Symmachiella dynata TaxID=2527995 RepID=UPI0030EB8FC9
MPIYSATTLQQFATQLFQAAGVPSEEAAIVAASLVEANLRGHDSHGVMRIRDYVRQLRIGELVPGVELAVRSETAAMLAADAQFGFGQVQARRLIMRLMDKAGSLGIASGTLMRCGHIGRLGEWVELAAEAGFAALVAVNDNGSLRVVAPPGGTEPQISTNPLAIGVPTTDGPLVLDISTSAVANGKIRLALAEGVPCPDGWLLDGAGDPTNDPEVRRADPPGTIQPLGGAQAGYKGFGLGLMLDILIGGLSGGFCPPQEDADSCNNVLAIVWQPQQFKGTEHFLAQADQLIASIRNSRRKVNVERIRLPGDRSREVREQRLRDGIPFDDGNWQRLVKTATELDVALPTTP